MSLWLYQWKTFARRMLRKVRGMVSRRSQPIKNRHVRLLSRLNIDVVFDGGANNGQYGRQLIASGYENRIVSFEPLTTAFGKLQANAQGNRQWEVLNIALGSVDGTDEINVAGNEQSSSLLNMAPQPTASAAKSAYVGKQEITVRRIDSIIDEHCQMDDRVFLKLDVQGYEKHVLEGAANSLDRFSGVQLEMSTASFYEGEASLLEMIPYMQERGFALASLGNVWSDPQTMQLMQVDGTFVRLGEAKVSAQAA